VRAKNSFFLRPDPGANNQNHGIRLDRHANRVGPSPVSAGVSIMMWSNSIRQRSTKSLKLDTSNSVSSDRLIGPAAAGQTDWVHPG